MFDGKLRPYQIQNAYYKGIQVGQAVDKQCRLISEQTKVLAATQMASASAIVASQERISEGIDSVVLSVERVADGIDGLKSAFEWGIGEVIWQIEQNRKVLRNIEEGIWSPFDAQARNRKKQAEEAYQFGWIEEAEEYFLESEKIVKTDFSVHISLALIYLFHNDNLEQAITYLDKAIKYSKPKSNYFCSFALLHKALVLDSKGSLEGAASCTREAIELSPEFAEAQFQNAMYNARLKRTKEAIESLERAILQDKFYTVKADKDKSFDGIREDVNKLICGLTARKRKIVGERFSEQDEALRKIKAAKDLCQGVNLPSDMELRLKLERVGKLLERNSYFDALEAENLVQRGLAAGIIEHLNQTREIINTALTGRAAGLVLRRDEMQRERDRQVEMTINNPLTNILGWIILAALSGGLFMGLVFGLQKIDTGRTSPLSLIILFPFAIFFLYCTFGGGYVVAGSILERLSIAMKRPVTDHYDEIQRAKKEREDLLARLNRIRIRPPVAP